MIVECLLKTHQALKDAGLETEFVNSWGEVDHRAYGRVELLDFKCRNEYSPLGPWWGFPQAKVLRNCGHIHFKRQNLYWRETVRTRPLEDAVERFLLEQGYRRTRFRPPNERTYCTEVEAWRLPQGLPGKVVVYHDPDLLPKLIVEAQKHVCFSGDELRKKLDLMRWTSEMFDTFQRTFWGGE